MAGTFTHTTLQQLVDMLAQDLGDTGKVFFTSTELQRALVDALRLSNALTARARYTLDLTTTPGQGWYDLHTLAPTALGYTTTDRTVIEDVQYALMEPIEPSAGAGMTEMHQFTEALRTLQQVRDRFLVETEVSIERPSPITNVPIDGIVDLPDTTAKILRAVWVDHLGRRTVLRNPTDEGTMSAVAPMRRLSSGSTPRRWSTIAGPQLQLQLDPPPGGNPALQSLELSVIQTGPALSTTANSNAGTVLEVPDDLAWGLRYDALELLLSKHGMAHDGGRSELAGQLGTFARAIARSLPNVLEVVVGGTDLRIGQAAYLDAKDPNWESGNRNIPRRAVVHGDWLGLHPVPDDTIPVRVTLVAKLPTLGLSDFVQIGREHLSGILAWAKQMVLFKVGGRPLAAATRTAGLLVEQARAYNEARVMSSQYLAEYFSQGQDRLPSTVRDAPPVDLSGDPRDEASSRNTRNRNVNYRPYNRQIGGR